jgi:hypothetical protein
MSRFNTVTGSAQSTRKSMVFNPVRADQSARCVAITKAGTMYAMDYENPSANSEVCTDQVSPSSAAEMAFAVLWAGVLEQLMRSMSDATLLLKLARSSTHAQKAAALGEIFPSLEVVPQAGSPIPVALGFGSLEESWRTTSPMSPGCLWSELSMLRSLGCSPADACTLLDELFAARETSGVS